MSFTMPNVPAMRPPATRPAPIPRRFYDLTPQDQQAMLDQGWQPREDGTATHPDGRTFGMDASDPSLSSDLGGYGGAPSGPPATSPAVGPIPQASDQPAPPPTPFEAPQFDRYFNTANAPMPGTPGGLGGGPLPGEGPNPMGEPVTSPFEAPEVTPPLVVNNGGGPANVGVDKTAKTSQYGGRVGRRMAARGTSRRGRG